MVRLQKQIEHLLILLRLNNSKKVFFSLLFIYSFIITLFFVPNKRISYTLIWPHIRLLYARISCNTFTLRIISRKSVFITRKLYVTLVTYIPLGKKKLEFLRDFSQSLTIYWSITKSYPVWKYCIKSLRHIFTTLYFSISIVRCILLFFYLGIRTC